MLVGLAARTLPPGLSVYVQLQCGQELNVSPTCWPHCGQGSAKFARRDAEFLCVIACAGALLFMLLSALLARGGRCGRCQWRTSRTTRITTAAIGPAVLMSVIVGTPR